MGLFNSIRLGSSAAGDYEVKRSLTFNDDDTAYLSRTPSSAGDRKKWTFSAWIKRGNLGGSAGEQRIFGGNANASHIYFPSNDEITWDLANEGSGSSSGNLNTTQKFRDPSAWFHLVCALDTDESTADNRMRMYINGTEVTSFGSRTNPSSGYATNAMNNNTLHTLGYRTSGQGSAGMEFDGYMAEVHFIDGQQYDASYFAETDALTGEYKPKKYAGSYGTNGFKLTFSDNSGTTATTLGKDSSGNGNNFTPNNFGTGDSVKDSPTNNFCTLNSAIKSPDITFTEGNLKGFNNTEHKSFYGTFGLSSGKWYWEAEATSGSSTKWTYGVSDVENVGGNQVSGTNMLLAVSPAANYAKGDAVSIYNTKLYKNGSVVTNSYQTNPSAGDIIGIALDVDAGKVWFSRNGTWINGSASASTTLDASNHDTTVATGKSYTPAYSVEGVGWCTNFGQDSSFANATTAQGNTDGNGQGDFYYAVPSGFKAICNANLPDPAIALPNKHFDILLWSGNNSSRNITGLEFDPDFVWAKNRTIAYSPEVYDTVRGNTKRIFPDSSNQENSTGALSFGVTGGFALAAGGGLNDDDGTNDIVAWNWKGGGSASSNTDGSITSSVSANTTAGFSIVTYTGNATDGATVGHGLGVAPDCIITKSRNLGTIGSAGAHWTVAHKGLTNGMNGGSNARKIHISLNQAEGTNSHGCVSAVSSTTFTLKDGSSGTAPRAHVNESSGNYVAYVFSEVAGYSKFGSYTGNNNTDGTFVYTGFQPTYLVIKKTNSASNWIQWDNARMTHNVMETVFELDGNNTESGSSNTAVDFLSNGFKFRNNYTKVNGDGDTYIYIAFAESPFKYSRAR